MRDLIEALQIFQKYADLRYPINCEHDELNIVGIEKEAVSEEDQKRLEDLDFFWSEHNGCFISFRFGSA